MNNTNGPICTNPNNCQLVRIFLPEHKKGWGLLRSGWNQLLMQRDGSGGFALFYRGRRHSERYGLAATRVRRVNNANYPDHDPGLRIFIREVHEAELVGDSIEIPTHNGIIYIQPCDPEHGYEHCKIHDIGALLEWIRNPPRHDTRRHRMRNLAVAAAAVRGGGGAFGGGNGGNGGNGGVVGYGGRKRRKRKTTKRKTVKRKSKARMTKQKRKVNGVTRNVRISSTGRKYVLLKGKRHYL